MTTPAVRPPRYRPPRMLHRLRAAAATILVGHPNPLRLIDLLATTGQAAARREAILERRVDILEARVAELYVDASLISALDDAAGRRNT